MSKRNKLREKIGDLPAKLDPSVVAQVEKGVAAFNVETENEFEEQIALLQEFTADGPALIADAQRRRILYEFVHRFWGDAPSRGYPLLGRVAESLCLLLDNDVDQHGKQVAILEHHVAAVVSIWANRNQEEQLAEELVRSLEDSTREYKL